jgi:Fic family protein
MRVPRKPPNEGPTLLPGRLADPAAAAKVDEIVRKAQDQYLHWEEFRHIFSAPPGTSAEEIWRLLRIARSADRRTIPLVSTGGKPFSYCVPECIQRDLHWVDRFGGGRQHASPLAEMDRDERERYLANSLMEEAITSSQVEGAAVTRDQAKEMLRTGRRPRNRSERMVLNNYHTMQRIKALSDRPLSPGMVLELQRIVTEGTLDKPDAAGRLRRPDESIDVADEEGNTLHAPPPAGELPERMERLCAFANETGETPFTHPVVRAILLHFWLAYDHPFVDGNGRTARALFYWYMLRSGYRLIEFISISSIMRQSYGQYRDAFLYAETDSEDATYFLAYHLKVIRQALAQIEEYVTLKRGQSAEIVRLLDGREDLNYRQQALLARAIHRRNTLFTFRSHATSHNVTLATARKDLLHLAGLGLLEKRKRGREFVFIAPRDLPERLNPSQT